MPKIGQKWLEVAKVLSCVVKLKFSIEKIPSFIRNSPKLLSNFIYYLLIIMIRNRLKTSSSVIDVNEDKLRKLQKEFLRGHNRIRISTKKVAKSERQSPAVVSSASQLPKPYEVLQNYLKKRNIENQESSPSREVNTSRKGFGSTAKLHAKPTHRRIYSDQFQNGFNIPLKQEPEENPQNFPINLVRVSPPKTDARKKSFFDLNLTPRKKSPLNASKQNSINSSTSELQIEEETREKLIQYISSYFRKHLEEPTTSLEFYQVGEMIGKGAFGRVMLGVHNLTGYKVALKAIEKIHMKNEDSRRKVLHEVLILKKVRHKRVNRILEVFESSKFFYIVMEYAGGGDLLHFVKRKGKILEGEAKRIFRQILEGAIAIHSHGIIHRDFKLDNILIDSDYSSVKICDFGVSRSIKKGDIINEQCGTPAYLAPEMIIGRGYEGVSVDIWSLGVLLYAMLCGTVPFKAKNLNDLHKLILLGKYNIPDHISEEAKDLISKFLTAIPQYRITLREALEHRWFYTEDTEPEAPKPRFSDIQTERDLEKINESIVSHVSKFGYPRSYLINALQNGDLNHSTASYYILQENALKLQALNS
ncbi:unnamed protein product [Blepharisma stoltei]|uniref:Protein kinase domain-containing protein n=1 Tax=Blepharisma stoltei TaxID=1481888 RepID=A0AAU9IDL0_9CILI|nr:unnamed protein product [Blepharisma stoltei]